MNCDVGEATEGLEIELWRRWSDGQVGKWAELIVIVIAELILQPSRDLPYVTTHSPTLPSLYHVTSHSPTLPLLHLCHSSFCNPSFASPTSQAFHLIHLANRPCPICDGQYRWLHARFSFAAVIHGLAKGDGHMNTQKNHNIGTINKGI